MIALTGKIGTNVVINNSYIWNNVTIEEGAVINNSIIANGAVIKKNASVRSGSVVSYNVVVKESGVVPERTQLFVRKDGVAASYCEKGSEFTDALNEWEFLGSKPTFLDKNFEDDEALEDESDEDDGQTEQIGEQVFQSLNQINVDSTQISHLKSLRP